MANGMTRQYIGARYVPIFADPVEWDDERTYEPLMMVQHQGETYMTKQYVPVGIPLPTVSEGQESNDYWVHMSNWNAQVEGYREEVLRYAAEVLLFDGRITATEQALPVADFDSTNTVSAAISAINTAIDAITANDWVTTARIADANVTTAKIADSAVTTAKIADANVTTAKIADSAITSAKIADGSIVPADLAGHSMIVIGDSFTNDVDEWPTFVAGALNLTLYNYAENSAGWSALGALNHTFADLMQMAVNNLTEAQRALVDYVVVYGGINDVGRGQAGEGETVADVQAGAEAFCNYCTKANFPNAKFIIASFNGDNRYWIFKPNFQVLQTAVMEVFKAKGAFSVVPGVCKWLLGYPTDSVFISDGLHPNALGQKIIATNMLNILQGGGNSSYRCKVYPLTRMATTPANVTNVSMRLIVEEDFAYFQGEFTTDSTFNGGVVDIAELPVYISPVYGGNPSISVEIPTTNRTPIVVSGETTQPRFKIPENENKLIFVCPNFSNQVNGFSISSIPIRIPVVLMPQ